MLLALSSAGRGSELIAHDLWYIPFHPEGVSFNLPELTKGVRVGKPVKTSFHASFPQNELLCPCSSLKEYEKRTKPFRPSSETEPNKLFFSVNRPHTPIAAGILSHWVQDCLLDEGIDSNVFKVHSIRSTATSGAAKAGISISKIIRLVDWTKESTFKKFYYRPIRDATVGRAIITVSG